MTQQDYADLSEAMRGRLIQVTMARGHDRDRSEDIVQDVICRGMRFAYRLRRKSDLSKFLSVACFREACEAHSSAAARANWVSSIEEVPEEELSDALVAEESWDEADLKLDVNRALRSLSEDDRELARMLFIEGMTYEQTLALYRDRFGRKEILHAYVATVIKPLLREVLAEYAPVSAPPYTTLRVSVPTYIVVEQVPGPRRYTLEPVTAQVRTHRECQELVRVLEQRYREDELECREDWDQRETPQPLTATLQHLGNRTITRLFTIRRKETL